MDLQIRKVKGCGKILQQRMASLGDGMKTGLPQFALPDFGVEFYFWCRECAFCSQEEKWKEGGGHCIQREERPK